MTELQYRTRGKGKHGTKWEWRDISELPDYWTEEPGAFYFSSIWQRPDDEHGGLYDIEVRVKPEAPMFKPGYFRDVSLSDTSTRIAWFSWPPSHASGGREIWKRVEVTDVD